MPSGVATPGEARIEAALVSVLRRAGYAVLAVAGPCVSAVLVAVVSATVV
jgi:hypothetical protein